MTPYLRAGIPGDFRPFACRESDGRLVGHDIDLLDALARAGGFRWAAVPTDWTGLSQGLGRDFDVALGGVTITPEREAQGDFLPAYAPFWKTAIVRKTSLGRFKTVEDLNGPSVTVIKNPGGTNERWVNKHLTRARVLLEAENVAIPAQIAEGTGDVMVTDVTEARHYARRDARLAVLPFPLTARQMKGVWMAKGFDGAEMLRRAWYALQADGTLAQLARTWDISG